MAKPKGTSKEVSGAGRPLKFKSPEELEKKCKEYFEVTHASQVTITGLALHLDTCRQTLMDYQGKPEYSDTIKKAKLAVENAYELSLRESGRTGDIFALKNFGWKDKQEMDLNANITTSDALADMDDPE